MRVLVINAGSSSLKICLLDPGNTLLREVNLDADRGQPQLGAVATAIKSVGPVDAVGHRVVHGGTCFTGPVVVDAGVLAELGQLVALARCTSRQHWPRCVPHSKFCPHVVRCLL